MNNQLINIRETLNQQVEPFKAALVEQFLSQAEQRQQVVEHQADKVEGSSRWFDGRLVRGTCHGQFVSRGSAQSKYNQFGRGLSIVWNNHSADSDETIGMMADFNPHGSALAQEPWSRSSILKMQQEFDGLVRDVYNVEQIDVDPCYNFGVSVYTPKTRDEMLDEAKRYADTVWAAWLNKMVEKLEKMHVTSIQVSGDNPLDNTLVVGSVHGITFDLKNSIVFKWSNNCGYFNQFPARFTNVRCHGDKVKGVAKKDGLENFIKSEVDSIVG